MLVEISKNTTHLIMKVVGSGSSKEKKAIDLGVEIMTVGKIGSSVSKTTTHLVCKDPGVGSSKLVKAAALGVKIISVEELQNLLKNI